MPDFNVRSESVNVEQIMEQIRARIREKRGVDYTEQQIRDLATVKLEKFLDPKGVRSDLLEQFRRAQASSPPAARSNYAFGAETLYETHRASVRWIRKLLRPILKLFFNPNPLIQALHIQTQLNAMNADRELRGHSLEHLYYEVFHNLVVEMTRMGIEIKNLKMRVESLTGRLEFNERRARALESVVAYQPSDEARAGVHRRDEAPSPPLTPTAAPGAPTGEGPGQRSRRRRRRRGRRGSGSVAAQMGAQGGSQAQAEGTPPEVGPTAEGGPAAEGAAEISTPGSPPAPEVDGDQ